MNIMKGFSRFHFWTGIISPLPRLPIHRLCPWICWLVRNSDFLNRFCPFLCSVLISSVTFNGSSFLPVTLPALNLSNKNCFWSSVNLVFGLCPSHFFQRWGIVINLYFCWDKLTISWWETSRAQFWTILQLAHIWHGTQCSMVIFATNNMKGIKIWWSLEGAHTSFWANKHFPLFKYNVWYIFVCFILNER